MESHRHNKTIKRTTEPAAMAATAADSRDSSGDTPVSTAALVATLQQSRSMANERFKNLLDAGTRETYARPWHRIERGFRLNRLRLFIEEVAPQFDMNAEEKEDLYLFLQKALDKKQLNTLKVVQYDIEKQRILSIKGLELKRGSDGILKGVFGPTVKPKADATRKKRKGDIPSVSTLSSATVSGGKMDASDENEKKE